MNIIKRHAKKLIITSVTAALLSCAATKQANDAMTTTDDAITTANKKLSGPQSIATNNFNYEMDSIYVSTNSVQRKETENLPAKFADSIQIDGAYSNMRQVADTLQRLTGYPVLLNLENKDMYVRLTQTRGSLTDLLNNLCAQTDTSWSFLQGKLIISDLETETFFIKALPGDVQVQNQVNSNSGINSQSGGSGSAGEGGGGSATSQSNSNTDMNTIQNVQFNVTHSIWTNISDTVKGMLTKQGSMNVSPSTSSITITDKPSSILKVQQYIKKQNDMLKQQVQIDVQVFTIETDAADNYMINWNLVLKGTSASFNMNGMAGGGTGGSAAGGLVPVFTPTATTQSFTVAANSGSLSGSQLMANAISTNTKSSLVTSAAATTLNNQPVPIQIIEQQGYVSNVSTTQVAQAGAQQSVTTGQLSYGFTLNVLPTIEKNGLVNLQLSLNLSSLKALRNFSVTGATVQLPDMIQRNAMQKVTMRDGDTYVTTGFDSDFNTITNVGVGSPNFWLFGGGTSAQGVRQKVVIMVTPRVVKY
jgi:type IVB pilus formation R64 PilN family outer membrane protein